MAQSTAGTNLTTNAEVKGARPCLKVEVAWGKKWSDAISGGDWVDETEYVTLPVTVERSLTDPDSGFTMVGQTISASATVTMDNSKANHRFSPFNSSSPIYSSIRDGQIRNTPIRISMGFYDGATAELLMQFTGLITSQPPSSAKQAVVTWSCLGRSEAIKDIQGRTTIYEDTTLTDWVEILAGEAGIAAADQNFDIDDAELQWIWLDDEYVWMKLQEAAEAAGGMIYFDHSGVLRFEGMQHWVDGSDHMSSQYSYTTAKFEDLQPGYSYNDGYSSAVVEYIRRSESYTETVWEDDEPELIPPGESIKRTARLQYPCTTVLDPEEEKDYSCITTSGVPKNDDATVTMTAYAAQAEIEVANGNSTYAIIATGLRLRGRPLVGGQNAEVKMVTAAGFISDTKEFRVSGNQCIQSHMQAERLATFYRDRLERVPCVFTIPSSPAKPWLELGDRVTVVCSDEGINHEA